MGSRREMSDVMRYRVIRSTPSGEDCYGEFTSLDEAQELFELLCLGDELQPDDFLELVDDDLNAIDSYQIE